MEHLIQCVRRYPCLWNTSAIEYRDQELKDAAWAEVMNETDLSSVKEVKLKWKKLRDSYRDALKRQSEVGAAGGGAGASKRSSAWKYTGQMQFLQPYMNNRKKPGELPAPAPPASTPAPAPPAPTHENGHRSPDPEPDSDEDSESSERAVPAAPAPLPAPTAPVPAPARKRAASPDPLETFFTGMCQATRRLPFPAQLRIKRALFEAVAAGEETLLAEHRRYAAAAAALWPRTATSASARASSTDDDDDDDTGDA